MAAQARYQSIGESISMHALPLLKHMVWCRRMMNVPCFAI